MSIPIIVLIFLKVTYSSPKDEEGISEAIKYLVGNNIPLAVKGGGHNPSGASSTEDGVVIDLSRYINHVNVDPELKTADVGGGALWEAVDETTIVHGLATVGGTMSGTSVGGLSIGGGQGVLTGKHGQVVGNILKMTVVLADGSIVKASANSHPNLFWGLRGGGGNFGVMSQFRYQLHPQRKTVYVYDGDLVFDENQFVDLAFTRGSDGEAR
ncbi:hypothetical protein Clacol_004129 [Clathrus columnatus]|uniref:FAD-binding PCMH-type domain-containing protein n=1 Tax=Clathrus columnatus TaxID=1419009 RepID=A0AAV5AAG9_9AGAM|nr:hypothetical protein Clacol_004129 [Clathrus columnatus]